MKITFTGTEFTDLNKYVKKGNIDNNLFIFTSFQILMSVLATMDIVDRFAQTVLEATLVHVVVVIY